MGVERLNDSNIRVYLSGNRTQAFYLRPEDRVRPRSWGAKIEEPRCLRWARVPTTDKLADKPLYAMTGEVVRGSNPREVTNRRTDHPFGGKGLFFVDPNGHLFEIMTVRDPR